jgi:hypothetical protein
MQRHAMLMFTSCGWFFTEISGIETLQILQYAARAIQLARDISGISLENEFTERLSKAKSNLEMFKDGLGVYEKMIKPGVASIENIVASFAMGSIFENYYPQGDEFGIYCYDLRAASHRKESSGNLTLNVGHVQVISRTTLEQRDLIFSVVQIGLYDFHCSIKPFSGTQELEIIERELFEELYRGEILELIRKTDKFFGAPHFTLKDLFLEDRMKIITLLTREQIDKVSKFYERIYDESYRINFIYRSINLPIPMEFCYAAGHVLSRRLMDETAAMAEQNFSLRRAAAASRIIETAKLFHIDVRKEPVAQFLSRALEERIHRFVQNNDPEIVRECVNIHKLSEKFEIELEYWLAQEELFFFLRKWQESPELIPEAILSSPHPILQLLNRMHLAFDGLRKFMAKPHA